MNITKTNKKSIKEYISLLNILIFISIDKKNKKINTIRKLREQRLFTPSIKLNPFINTKKKNDVPSKLIFHNLGKKYPEPPITSSDTGLVVHRAILNDITGTSTLLDWSSDGHASIVEMGRLIKRDTEFSAALDALHTFIEGDLGGQIIQITDTRLMLLPPGCRGLKGVEMEAFAAGAEELGRRRL